MSDQKRSYVGPRGWLAPTRSRLAFGLAVPAVLALALAGCGSDGSSEANGGGSGPILVGATQGITGVGAASCGPIAKAQEAWLDHVNSEGGVNGRTFEYKLKDDGFDPTRSVSNARALLTRDHVMTLLGGCSSGTTAALVPFAEQNKIPYIAPYGSVPELFSPPKDYSFGLFPAYESQFGALIDWAYKDLGPGSVMGVTFSTNEDLYQKDVIDKVEGAGQQYLGGITFKIGQSSFSSEVLQLKEKNPDYIVFAGAATDATNLVKEMARQDWRPGKMILSMGTMADDVYASSAGDAAEGISVAGSPFILTDDPAAAPCADALGIPQSDLTSFNLFGCASADILVEAVRQLGDDVSSESLAALMRSGFSADIPFIAGGKAQSAPDHILNPNLLPVTVMGGKLALSSAGAPLIPVPAEGS